MLSGKTKSQLDEIWDAISTGGITSPISIIEQFTYLLFIRRLDEMQIEWESEDPSIQSKVHKLIFSKEQQNLRWNIFKNFEAAEMFGLVKDAVFPLIKNNPGENLVVARHTNDAIFMITSPDLLKRVVNMVDQIDMSDRVTNGELYEYMLLRLQTLGTHDQVFTPRHIIRMMVCMTQPKLDGENSDIICDPAAGTCGFLIGAEEYVRKQFTDSPKDFINAEHFHYRMFNAFEIDSHMLRIGAMNLMMHGVARPMVEYRDFWLDQSEDNFAERYTLVLSSLLFDGNSQHNEPSSKLLFLSYILRILKVGGRAAVIVPDDILSDFSNPLKVIRETLIEGHILEGVVSMPGGVFEPGTSVSTAILFFTKTNAGGTEKVWFYDMQADGFSQDDQRSAIVSTEEDGITGKAETMHKFNNISDIICRWIYRDDEIKRLRTEQSFIVSKEEIVKADYDLFINTYKK